MLRVSGVSSRSCRSCLGSELRPAVQNALLSATALYRVWGRVGLSAIRPSGFVMTIILIGLCTGGCSFSRNDKSAYAKADDSDLTGSVAKPAQGATQKPLPLA